MSVDARSRIRCVAFDAVGTLIHPQPAAAEAYALVARRFGSRLGGEVIASRFRRKFRETEQGDLNGPEELRLATSESVERERWRSIVTTVIDDIGDPEGCFAELFEHFQRPESWRCFDDVSATITSMQAMGLELAVASNFDGRLHRVCDGLPVVSGLTCRIVSAEVGYRKPSPRFFEALLARMGCEPDELLMVGDDRENDWEGARRAGVPAVLINRRGEPGPGEIRRLTDLTHWLADGKASFLASNDA